MEGIWAARTLSPTVTIETTESTVFERLSVTEPWASRSVATTVTLTPAATTTNGVTQLVVIVESGSTFDSTTVGRLRAELKRFLITESSETTHYSPANPGVVPT